MVKKFKYKFYTRWFLVWVLEVNYRKKIGCIVVMVLDLMHVYKICCWLVDGVEKLLFLVGILAHQGTDIKKDALVFEGLFNG